MKHFILFTAAFTILYPAYTSAGIREVDTVRQITFMDSLDRRSRSRIEETKAKARPGWYGGVSV